jgi:hypothetical protein
MRMSSFKHPVGSQPSKVYWRRRLAVIAVLLLVIVVIVLIATKPGSGSEAGVVTPSTAASAKAKTGDSTATSGTSATKAPAAPPTPSSTATAAAGDGGTCTASDITLKPLTDKSTYTSLQQPQISMSITNNSTAACTIDLGSSQQALTITSGAETYWSSKDCQVNGTHQNVNLTPGQTLKTPAIAWDRTRSSSTTCSTARSAVPAKGASYHLSVSVGAITSSATALMILN